MRSFVQQYYLLFVILLIQQALLAQNVTQLSTYRNGDIGSNPKELISYGDQVVFRIQNSNIVSYNPQTKEHFFIENRNTGNRLTTSIKTVGAKEFLNPIIFTDKLYFTAFDPDQGPGIYAFDGVDAELVASILLSDYDSNIYRGRATVHNGKLYTLISPTPNEGLELYAIDPDHNVIITEDLNPGPGDTELDNLTSFQNHLFFTYHTSTHGTEWWSIPDGQKATLYYDIYNGTRGSEPNLPHVVGDVLYFAANDGIHRHELWKIEDDITSLVEDITINIYNRPPTLLTSLNSELYFLIGGTIRKIDSSTDSISIIYSGISNKKDVVNMQNDLYFYGVGEIHKYDTALDSVVTIGSISNVRGLMTTKDQVVILSTDDKVYSTLGQVGDLIELIPESPIYWSTVIEFWSSKDFAFFAPSSHSIGKELWQVGANRQCLLSANFERRNQGLYPKIIANEEYIYFAYDSLLWRSDGSKSGTSLFKNLGSDYYSILPLTTWEQDIYVAAHLIPQPFSDQTNVLLKINANTGDFEALDTFAYSLFNLTIIQLENAMLIKTEKEVIRIEQQSKQTEQIDTIFSDYAGGQYFEWQGDLYHTMYSGENQGQLHKNKELLVDFREISGGYESPRKFIEWNNELYFLTKADLGGYVIWRTDGTAQGTKLFSDDFTPNYSQLDPVATTNALYFGYQSGYDRDFIVSDGSESGPALLGSAGGLSYSIGFHELLLFTGYDETHGYELWGSHGEIGDAQLIKDIIPGQGGGTPLLLTQANNLVYFRATDPIHGLELWQTDGTQENTVMVEDIYPGFRSSSPTPLMEFKGNLIFLAGNENSHLELYIVSECKEFISLSCPDTSCDLVSSVLTSSGAITVDLPHTIPSDEHVILNASDGFSTDTEFTILNDAKLTIETDGCN